MSRTRAWFHLWDYREWTGGEPLPVYCRQCSFRLKRKVQVMLPVDPHTGYGKSWDTLYCPNQYNSRWHRGWTPELHDAWLIERRADLDPEVLAKRAAEQKAKDDAWATRVTAWFFGVLGALAVFNAVWRIVTGT